MKRIAVLMTLCLAFCAMTAQNRYATQRLRGIAEALGLSERIASLPSGSHSQGMSYGSYPLVVEVADGVVSHIGWRLPPHDNKTEAHRFVERVALEEAMYRDDALPVEWDCPDEAFVVAGSIADVLDADSANIAYTCANIQGRQYQVAWSGPDGKVLCMMAFPIKYQLLTGATLREIENALYGRLRDLEPSTEALVGYGSPRVKVTDSSYTAVVGPARRGSLLKNIIYLDQDTALVFDPQLPVESLANAVSSTTASEGIMADVKMLMYGADGRGRTFAMPLSAMVGEFLGQGCIPYFGLMEGSAEGGEIAAAVKMVNNALGYVHLLKVKADPDILFGPEPRVEVTLAAYVNDKPIQEIINDEIQHE